METTIIGLIDNTLYLHPFYAGDHIHQATVSDTVKSDLIERDVRVFTSYREIEEYVMDQIYLSVKHSMYKKL